MTRDRFARAAVDAAAASRGLQKNIDRKGKTPPKKKAGAMQAGARIYPEPPLPAQHLEKPGNEADLDLAPMYDAPHYNGSMASARARRQVQSPQHSGQRARQSLEPVTLVADLMVTRSANRVSRCV